MELGTMGLNQLLNSLRSSQSSSIGIVFSAVALALDRGVLRALPMRAQEIDTHVNQVVTQIGLRCIPNIGYRDEPVRIVCHYETLHDRGPGSIPGGSLKQSLGMANIRKQRNHPQILRI